MSDLIVSENELRDLLVTRLDVLNNTVFDEVRDTARRLRIPLPGALSERARVPLSFILKELAEAWQVGYTDLRMSDVHPEVLVKIPEAIAKSKLIAAFALNGTTLQVAAANPRSMRLAVDLQQLTGLNIELLMAPVRAIRRAHMLYSSWLSDALQRSASGAAVPVGKAGQPEPAATQLVTNILEYAIASGASDIHIEPYEFEGLVRYRIDGVLHEAFSLSPEGLPSLAARLKVLGTMRVDERRAPQDGRFAVTLGGAEVDLRVSSLPTHWGEKIVMRVLSKETAAIDLEALGMVGDDYQILLRCIMRPFGLILVTGPTGSGKTTTLYATLSRLAAERQGQINISTIEDPVEHAMPRVSQIAVNPTAGIDFPSGLRALLRQDPDVLMVGEIRDHATAEICVRAALVGRLLLSTLHTNDAAGAIPRLIDMGIERFLLASTLELVVAQRLARRICTACRETTDADLPAFKVVQETAAFAAAIPVLQKHGVLSKSGNPLARVRLFRGRGCERCSGTGYRGRIGLFELLEVNDEIRHLIVDPLASSTIIRGAATRSGMKTMFEDGLGKVFQGETTIEEAVRASS
ncbi:MAG: GspE/PulE family protein [Vicinamibacterales bacterium]